MIRMASYFIMMSVLCMIPSEVGSLKKLKELSVHYNSFTGEIPIKISDCTELTDLDIGVTNLNGSPPSEIGALTKLEYISMYNNSIVGTIPTEIGQLTSLTNLFLSYNSLSVSIPSEFAALQKLQKLDISQINVAGTIPVSLCNDFSELNVDSRSMGIF
jgi:Leucine-rich repeat (LRR) protein